MTNELKWVHSGTTTTISNNLVLGGVTYDSDVNPDEDYMIGAATSASIKFTLADNTNNIQIGDEIQYKCLFPLRTSDVVSRDYWYTVGNFTVKEKVKEHNRYTYTCYDYMYKFDVDITSWLNGLTYPITVKNLLNNLCTQVGVTRSYLLQTGHYTNEDYNVYKNWSGTGITGRQLLCWIGEVIVSKFFIDPYGTLNIAETYRLGYPNNPPQYDSSNLKTYDISEDYIEPINKVKVAISTNDIGVSATYSGTAGDNCYSIYNNPILYNVTDGATVLQNIVNKLYDETYFNNSGRNHIYYGTFKPFFPSNSSDSSVKLGGTSKLVINGVTKYLPVNAIHWDSSGVTITAKGKQKRNIETAVATNEYSMINGRFHEFTNDINGLDSRVGTVETTVGEQGTTISTHTSQISQQSDKIALVVSESAGNNVVNSASITAAINSTTGASKVCIDADHVQMTGTTTFLSKAQADTLYDEIGDAQYYSNNVKNGLKTLGYTQINGGNITTGTIDAQYISTEIAQVNSALTVGNGETGNPSITLRTSDYGGSSIRYSNSDHHIIIGDNNAILLSTIGWIKLNAGGYIILGGPECTGIEITPNAYGTSLPTTGLYANRLFFKKD